MSARSHHMGFPYGEPKRRVSGARQLSYFRLARLGLRRRNHGPGELARALHREEKAVFLAIGAWRPAFNRSS